jgi:hypothetical protein
MERQPFWEDLWWNEEGCWHLHTCSDTDYANNLDGVSPLVRIL